MSESNEQSDSEASETPEADTGSARSLPPVLKRLTPYGISLVVHGVISVALAAYVLPILTRGSDNALIESAIASSAAMSEPLAESTTIDVAGATPAMSAPTAALEIPNSTPIESQLPDSPKAPSEVVVRRNSLRSLTNLSDADLSQNLNLGVHTNPMYSHRGQTRVQTVSNAVDVADTLQGDLLSIAKDGDAMVVWLLDQSLSMQKDLKILAQGLVDTLQQIEGDKSSKMQHAVVAFGDDVTLIQKPTFKGYRVANAIYQLPADPSGLERTFESVEWCLHQLFAAASVRNNKRQRLLVLWTDESGDDYLRLENTIGMCLRANVRVDIIGPSAVLGAQTGFSAYQHPEDGRTYYLPVHRGPDSAFPQKLSLGYWHRGVPGSFDESFRGPHQGTSPMWHGGSNLQGLLSGFSPYALTRLSRETGGRYLMYDRPGDRAPYSDDLLQDYRPDYRSARDILFELNRQPLRQIILASASRTWADGLLTRSQPKLSFRPNFGGQAHPDYLQSVLVPQLRSEIRRTWEKAQRVEQALQPYFLASAMPKFEPDQGVSGHRRLPERSLESEADPQPGKAESKKSNDETDAETDVAADSATDSKAEPGEPTSDEPSGSDDVGEDASSDEKSDAVMAQDERRREKDSADEDEDLETLVDLEVLNATVDQTLLEQLYEAESSPRWRAWNDLNLGRLLSVSVRMREFLVTSTQLLQNLDKLEKNTNSVWFSVSRNLQGGDPSVERLSIARRLLERCAEENAGTPWQVMAERELKNAVGLVVNQRYVPRPKMTTRPSVKPPPRPKLPNL